MSKRHALFAALLCVATLARADAQTASGPLPASAFAYDASKPLDVRITGETQHDGILTREITFASPSGQRIRGEVLLPKNPEHRGAVLFVHWLGDPPTTNHTEFARDAMVVAQHGSVALSIDAMWAQPDWYEKLRAPQTDFANSIRQVVDLRRALDVLLAQPGVDSERVAYVGHDFGAMYGAVLSGVDPRPKWYVLMAGNASFSQWYLYGAQPKDKAAFVAQMAQLDPAHYLGRATARAFLFQFARNDKYVSADSARAFWEAAPLPRGVFLYDADHSLAIPAAFADRMAWLEAQLNPSS
ncbi:MAG: hypothetical protein JOZ38_03225 [Candidatus Eremiobacteraeota bacterium]|nr:hypothetical protein [Candidatus Eremiobacteraeota bacterium]